MPSYIFDPVVRAHPKLTFQTVSTIADLFETSVTATAIRLVEGRYFPAILVCHGPNGRKWFTRSRTFPTGGFRRIALMPKALPSAPDLGRLRWAQAILKIVGSTVERNLSPIQIAIA